MISVGEKIIKNKDTLEKARRKLWETVWRHEKHYSVLYESNTDNLRTENVVSSTSIALLNSILNILIKLNLIDNEKLTEV